MAGIVAAAGSRAPVQVAVCGGGLIGWSCAYFLSQQPSIDPTRVAVVERDATWALGSSGRSASGIRSQYSNAANVKASLYSAEFMRNIAEHLTVDPALPADCGLREFGYLFLAASQAGAAVLRENHAVQQAAGASVLLLPPPELKARFPWLAVDDLALGALGTKNEGSLDATMLMQSFRSKAIAEGVQAVKGEVVGMDVVGDRIATVHLAEGTPLSPDTVINAAGPWADQVAQMAGASLPVEPRKRCVFVFKASEPLPGCPMVVDSTGVYFRPEGTNQYICGVSPPAEHDEPGFDWEVDHDLFEDLIWPALAHRVPALESLKVTGSWAGLYEYNTADQNAIVGRHDRVHNLVFANGFSGHGLQQSPAVGCAVAELICHGRYLTVDMSPFAFGRFDSGQLVHERNIV